jgi:hypothetical protein
MTPQRGGPLNTIYSWPNHGNHLQSSSYIGTYYAFSVIGPAVGYLGGGAILNLDTDIDQQKNTSSIDSSHPNWVGNW